MNKLTFFAAAALLLFSCTPGEIVTPGGNTPGGNTPGGDSPNDKPATVQVTGITLDKTTLTLVEGESVTLVSTVKPDNATNKAVTWTSSNESVATVDSDGKVTGVKAGTATIIAATQDGGKTAACTVTVNALTVLVTGITLDASLALEEGKSVTLIPTVKPDNVSDKGVVWTSSDESVATVDQNGKVTAKAKGTATIKVTAKDGSGVFAECSVSVYRKDTPAGVVDLGLPSGIKWAASNLSESGLCANPWDYGDYYAWGETEPYYSSQNPLTWKSGKTEGYKWPSYKWCKGSYNTLTKYCNKSSYGYNGFTDTKTTLEADDDAARTKLGGKWRMPTDEEWTELRAKCTWTWRSNYNGTGVNGRLITGPNGNRIFLPAAGYWFGTSLRDAGSLGYYWSPSLFTGGLPQDAYDVLFSSRGVYWSDSGDRYSGRSVRPVSE